MVLLANDCSWVPGGAGNRGNQIAGGKRRQALPKLSGDTSRAESPKTVPGEQDAVATQSTQAAHHLSLAQNAAFPPAGPCAQRRRFHAKLHHAGLFHACRVESVTVVRCAEAGLLRAAPVYVDETTISMQDRTKKCRIHRGNCWVYLLPLAA